MGALLKIREAGFVVALVGDKLSVYPASLLTQDQREFLKAHKAEIINDLATNDDIPNAPAAEPNVNQSLTCKGCIHFESYHDHGGGAGTCKAEVMPYGACHWSDTVHQCEKFTGRPTSESAHNAQGRYFKFLITRPDSTQFYSCSMPRMTMKEVRIQYHDAAAIESVANEDYPHD
jgi:hypothetical protein